MTVKEQPPLGYTTTEKDYSKLRPSLAKDREFQNSNDVTVTSFLNQS